MDMKKIILIVSLSILLSGCLTYQEYSFKFDYTTGRAEKIYHDLRSKKDIDEKDYSIEKDWAMLKEKVGKKFGEDLDIDVIKPIKAELFQEADVLSGREIVRVQLPKAFPSKTAILERLHADDKNLEFRIINGEIFLFAKRKEIKSSNGKLLTTKNNNIVVWPGDQVIFEFTINANNKGGKSFLPFYLEEKNLMKKK